MRGEKRSRGKERAGGGMREGGEGQVALKKKKKKRTQLTNMGKIPANEDGRSSGEPAGWGGIMTLTLRQGSNWGWVAWGSGRWWWWW